MPNILRFEDSAVFETPPLGRFTAHTKGRQAPLKRDMMDPFEGLEKHGINVTGNDADENSIAKKRKR